MRPPEVIAIIPARGGSKGLPRKNILPLAGKPLIAHSILAARECSRISRCIVSTEDLEIKQVSLEYGAEVIARPAELATDQTLSADVVQHVLDALSREGRLPDYFVLLQPTSPLRTSAHVEQCLQAFLASPAACTISVTEAEHHPYKDFTLDHGFLHPLFGAEFLSQARQRLLAVYRQNGAIYAMKSQTFLELNGFFVEPALPYIMENEDSIDIDSSFDLLVAELLLNSRQQAAST